MNRAGYYFPMVVWLTVLITCAVVIAQTRFVADLSAFVPKTPNERQQLLVEQLRDGVIARLMMIGIEGGNADERAELSRELALALRQTGQFVGVQNGESQAQDRAYVFNHRYLLSPAVTPERFSVSGLHAAIASSIASLSGSAGLISKQLLPRDPTSESLQWLQQFSAEQQPRDVDGVWASRDGSRALLLVYTRAAGSDTDAQARAIGTVRQTFDRLDARHNTGAMLVMSGTGVFSVASRDTIQGEVGRLASVSLLLVVGLLWLVYRSMLLLALGLLPVLSGALAGIAAVSVGFGHVHGLTLAFGTTLIGEAVDYSIYFFIQRTGKFGYADFWRTIWLGVMTSVAGFSVMLFSDFPGLAQLGLYSISGLLAAVLVTRYVLPLLTPQQLVLHDLSRSGAVLDWLIMRSVRLRWLITLLALTAAGVVWSHADGMWNRQLSALSPISAADQRLDQSLRADMGAPDMRYIAAFTAPDLQQALQGAEQVGAVLQHLVEQRVIGSFNSPASMLPSIALQRARQAALPSADQASLRLNQALIGLPIKAVRLQGFLQDMQSEKTQPPLLRRDMQNTAAALLVDSLLVKRNRGYLVLLPLRANSADGFMALDKVRGALANHQLPKVIVIDLLQETTDLFNSYQHEALLLFGIGCLAILGLLLVSLRSIQRTLRVVLPLLYAVLCVMAGLLLGGVQLTILHLIGLLLVVAIGSNYALFFDSGTQAGNLAYRRQTQVSLVVANLATVGGFGVLALSKVPVLFAVGCTVAPGTLLALIFSAIMIRERPHAGHD